MATEGLVVQSVRKDSAEAFTNSDVNDEQEEFYDAPLDSQVVSDSTDAGSEHPRPRGKESSVETQNLQAVVEDGERDTAMESRQKLNSEDVCVAEPPDVVVEPRGVGEDPSSTDQERGEEDSKDTSDEPTDQTAILSSNSQNVEVRGLEEVEDDGCQGQQRQDDKQDEDDGCQGQQRQDDKQDEDDGCQGQQHQDHDDGCQGQQRQDDKEDDDGCQGQQRQDDGGCQGQQRQDDDDGCQGQQHQDHDDGCQGQQRQDDKEDEDDGCQGQQDQEEDDDGCQGQQDQEEDDDDGCQGQQDQEEDDDDGCQGQQGRGEGCHDDDNDEGKDDGEWDSGDNPSDADLDPPPSPEQANLPSPEQANLPSQKERADPTYVPRESGYFFHDTRQDGGRSQARPPPAQQTPAAGPSEAESLSRWGHDRFQREMQAPRTEEEKRRTMSRFEDRAPSSGEGSGQRRGRRGGRPRQPPGEGRRGPGGGERGQARPEHPSSQDLGRDHHPPTTTSSSREPAHQPTEPGPKEEEWPQPQAHLRREPVPAPRREDRRPLPSGRSSERSRQDGGGGRQRPSKGDWQQQPRSDRNSFDPAPPRGRSHDDDDDDEDEDGEGAWGGARRRPRPPAEGHWRGRGSLRGRAAGSEVEEKRSSQPATPPPRSSAEGRGRQPRPAPPRQPTTEPAAVVQEASSQPSKPRKIPGGSPQHGKKTLFVKKDSSVNGKPVRIYSLARGRAIVPDQGTSPTEDQKVFGRGHGNQETRSNKVPGSARIKLDHGGAEREGHRPGNPSGEGDVERGGPKRYSSQRGPGGQEGLGKDQMFAGYPVMMMMPPPGAGMMAGGHGSDGNLTKVMPSEYAVHKPVLLPTPDSALLPPPDPALLGAYQQPLTYIYPGIPQGFPQQMGEVEDGYGHYQGGLFVPNFIPSDQGMMVHQQAPPPAHVHVHPHPKTRSKAIPILPPKE